MLMLGTHTVHIAGRGSVVRHLRIPVLQFLVLPDRNALRNPPRQHVPTVRLSNNYNRWLKYTGGDFEKNEILKSQRLNFGF